MPNIERIKLWVNDLRTTAVPQIKGYLEANTFVGGNCCLGRACRVAMENGLDLNVIQASNHLSTGGRHIKMGNEFYELPVTVMEWYGMDKTNPELLTPDGVCKAATTLNDELNFTFAQIADALEHTYINNRTA